MGIPQELKDLKQWIVWKDNKKPHSAVTMKPNGWQLPENQTTFTEALRVCKECRFTGIGFVFTFPYVGIDLDNCIEDGFMNEFAKNITDNISTFTEYSKSGNGLHLYCKVDKPIQPLKTAQLEIYGEGRFFIVTGKELDSDCMEITNQTENVNKLIEKYKPVKSMQSNPVCKSQVVTGERNNRMAAEIGRMFNYWDKETVYSMAHTLNNSICNPPLPENELNTIIESISKREIKPTAPSPIILNFEHIEGKRNLDTVPYRGLSTKQGIYIPTGIESLDYAINDLAPGCVTLIAGRMNGGKSTFVKQITANTIDTGNKVFLVMGEGDQETYINEMYRCVIGRDTEYYNAVKVNKRYHKEPLPHVLKALQRWHENKFVMFNKNSSKFRSMDELFQMIENEASEGNSKLIILDNLMSLLTAKAQEKNETQAEFMQNCHDLAIKHKVHLILVLHPNKEYRKGMAMEVEHISGTADLGNKADNVINVIREYDEGKIATGVNGKITLTKNRYYSDLIECETHFDSETNMLMELKDGNAKGYKFRWYDYLDEQYKWEPATTLNCPF